MIRGLSHIVVATRDVEREVSFFREAFSIEPHFSNAEFSEFVLPNRIRIAFFSPVGKAAQFFSLEKTRGTAGLGITVDNVETTYQKLRTLQSKYDLKFSGPPKDHPWGEKSFLCIDGEDNRWEITQSPNKDGFLPNR